MTAITPKQFAQRCASLLSDAIQSVVLYGSSVAGDFDDAYSDRNVLIIARRWNVGDLDALAPLVQTWTKQGNRPPLLFTLDEAIAAADTFPLEILDIQNAHEVLAGEPLPSQWRVDLGHLRLQLEREFKEKLLRLRERYTLATGNADRVAGLMVDSLGSFLVLARGALRLFRVPLTGASPAEFPRTKLDALSALAEHISFDVNVFRTVDDVKHGRKPARDVPAAETFAAYLRAVETIERATNDKRLQASDGGTR